MVYFGPIFGLGGRSWSLSVCSCAQVSDGNSSTLIFSTKLSSLRSLQRKLQNRHSGTPLWYTCHRALYSDALSSFLSNQNRFSCVLVFLSAAGVLGQLVTPMFALEMLVKFTSLTFLCSNILALSSHNS